MNSHSQLIVQGRRFRVKQCLKCGNLVVLEEGWFLCSDCHRRNKVLEDMGERYISHISDIRRESMRVGRS
jgi:Zn finger protein HypA/HybF involved in hydrogenase expression